MPQQYLGAFSTRSDGNMAFRRGDPTIAERNRRNFVANLGLDYEAMRFVRPTHSNAVALARTQDGTSSMYSQVPVLECDLPGYPSGCDGLVACGCSYAIAVPTGDCIPLLLWSQKSLFYGILHLGLINLANNTIGCLTPIFEECGVNSEDVCFMLGPSIDEEHYELESSGLWKGLATQIRSRAPHILTHVRSRGGRHYLDLREVAVEQLIQLGAKQDSISLHPVSTTAISSPYFSNVNARLSGDENGRFLSVIVPEQDAMLIKWGQTAHSRMGPGPRLHMM